MYIVSLDADCNLKTIWSGKIHYISLSSVLILRPENLLLSLCYYILMLLVLYDLLFNIKVKKVEYYSNNVNKKFKHSYGQFNKIIIQILYLTQF